MTNHFKGLLHLSYFTTFAYEFSQIKTTEFVITLKRPLVNARSGDDNVSEGSIYKSIFSPEFIDYKMVS